MEDVLRSAGSAARRLASRASAQLAGGRALARARAVVWRSRVAGWRYELSRRAWWRQGPSWLPGLVVVQLTLAVGGLAFSSPVELAHGATVRPTPVIADPGVANRPDASVAAAEAAAPAPPLPPATLPPQPAPPAVVNSARLHPHEVFAFAPYWTLDQEAGFDVADMSTVAYFGLDADGNGNLSQSGAGWEGYQSQALADLINRAHAASDRVVLTVECFDQATLDRLASNQLADVNLADNVIEAVRAKSMDGANFDFEGLGSADRAGIAHLMDYLAQRLHAADPHWQVTVDTYGGSATDPNGFFDVQAMEPYVDGFFVMAYDMYQSGIASPNAPLKGIDPSDADVVAGYLSAVPASKVILGIPFYGYDWQTADNAPEAKATSGPVPVSFAQVANLSTVYWDPSADVPWSEYQDPSGNWHEIYFDDPQSVALKAQLANAAGLAGVGIWALGMDGNDPAMMAAILGNARPVKTYSTGPARVSSSPSSTTTSTTTTSTTTPSTTRPSTTTPSTTTPSTPSTTSPQPGAPSPTVPKSSPSPPVTLPKVSGGGASFGGSGSSSTPLP